jgi:hypothetical protein
MIVSRASAALSQVENLQASMRQFEAAKQNEAPSPRIVLTQPAHSEVDGAPVITAGSIKFLKGTIVDVDCSSPPGAKLNVNSAGKKWTMQVGDSQHVVLIGADAFSCGWKNQKVAVNYRQAGELAGNVVSIEIQ